MACFRFLLIVLLSVIRFSECSYVDTLKKCHLHDERCHRHLIKDILKDLSKTGVHELGIPPIDPVSIQHLDLSIQDGVTLTLHDIVAKGVSRCDVKKFDLNVANSHASIELRCDITIKGRYKMQSTAPLARSLLGGDLHGEGNGKIKIDKISIFIKFPFRIQKRGSETFLTGDLETFRYSFNIRDKVEFDADSIYLGEKESSKDMIHFMNNNWKGVVDIYGNHVLDVTMKIVFEFVQKFFDNVPTRYYLLDDLTPYLH